MVFKTLPLGLVVALTFLAFPSAAHAYLDPGSSSLLLQLLLSGLAGCLIIIKVYWRRLKGVFGRLSERSESDHNSGIDK